MATKALTKQMAASKEARKFMARVYGWMTLALFLSGLTAFIISKNETLINFLWKTKYTVIAFLVIELVLVWIITAAIEKMPVVTAGIFYVAYSIVNGITLSAIFVVFKLSSITSIFLICSGMFACMTLFGMFTKTNISSFFRYFAMTFFGLLVAGIVNYFLKLDIISRIISVVSVLFFMGLTAVESQKLLKASQLAEDTDNFKKAAIYGALQLYIDFIGIFLNLLKLFGREKD